MSGRRWYTAMRHGAKTLDHAKWAKIVDEAGNAIAARFGRDHVFAPATPTRDRRDVRNVSLRSTDFVVSAQTILDVEAALAGALEAVAEIEALVKDDIDSARRDRIAAQLERMIHKIGERLKRGVS